MILYHIISNFIILYHMKSKCCVQYHSNLSGPSVVQGTSGTAQRLTEELSTYTKCTVTVQTKQNFVLKKNHLKTDFQFEILAHFKHILKTVHFSVMESQSDQRGFFITKSPHFLFCLRGIYWFSRVLGVNQDHKPNLPAEKKRIEAGQKWPPILRISV